jgi:TPR repeat protein
MGHLYQEGLGVRRDPAKSAKWYLEAADLGVVAAAWQLGEMYWNGDGVIRDRIYGYEFIYIAAMSNLPEARQEQERMEKGLTPKEMERGKARAKDWCRQHGALLVTQK